MNKRKRVLSKVKLVKEMSRERVPTPRPRVIPDKRHRNAANLARSIAARFGEEVE